MNAQLRDLSFFVQSENTYASELDGEICLFYAENTEYYILNKSGSKLWKNYLKIC